MGLSVKNGPILLMIARLHSLLLILIEKLPAIFFIYEQDGGGNNSKVGAVACHGVGVDADGFVGVGG